VKEAARVLRCSPRTVKNHLAAIRAKVGATSTAHAIALVLAPKDYSQQRPSERIF